ncbi:MAG: hypothetical protein M0R80_01725 [Proteobacteria bacterium]|jgi:phenylacetate-coenzyme A ligase PaaK-like adenylate-forming protein|nr:hypothetical protein [Pseudomonadota bacterium]
MIFAPLSPQYIRNYEHLTHYQTVALRYLKKKAGTSTNNVVLHTSGTTTGCAKMYKYSVPEFVNIEKYHFNKICYLNNLNPRLRIAWMVSTANSQSLSIDGPSTIASLNNNVYTISIPYNANKQQWEEAYDITAQICPDLVYTTPSTFMASYFATENKTPLNCVVMFSCETLFDDTRDKSLKIYTSVIDKMRAWDTGLSFIECRYGTKHIDDELCLVEQNNYNEITSTDFFNYSQPYASCKTDDLGVIQTKSCQCGIYGRVFTEFTGKSIQCLWDNNKTPCDPHTITSFISSFLKSKNQTPVPYMIRQNKKGIITLFIDQQNETSVLITKDVLKGLLHQPVQIEQYENAPRNSDNKLLFISSEFSSVQ